MEKEDITIKIDEVDRVFFENVRGELIGYVRGDEIFDLVNRGIGAKIGEGKTKIDSKLGNRIVIGKKKARYISYEQFSLITGDEKETVFKVEPWTIYEGVKWKLEEEKE